MHKNMTFVITRTEVHLDEADISRAIVAMVKDKFPELGEVAKVEFDESDDDSICADVTFEGASK